MMSLYNDNKLQYITIISCNTIIDRRDRVQYLTVSKGYSDNRKGELSCTFVM